jgi:hypothetical protein
MLMVNNELLVTLVRQLGNDIFLLQMMMHLKQHKANKHVVDHTHQKLIYSERRNREKRINP